MERQKRSKLARSINFSISEVKKQSEVVWQDKVCGWVLRLSLLFWLIQVILIGWFWRFLPPQVPLFYSRPWGGSRLSSPWGLIMLPGFSLIMLVVNTLISALVYKQDRLLAKMFLSMAAVGGFLLLFALSRIMLLVI